MKQIVSDGLLLEEEEDKKKGKPAGVKDKPKTPAPTLPDEDDGEPNIATVDDDDDDDDSEDSKGNKKGGAAPLPGRVDNTRRPIPADVADASSAFQDALKDAGIEPDDEYDDDGVDDEEVTTNQLVPLSELPVVVDKATGEELDLVWKDVKFLPFFNALTSGLTKGYFEGLLGDHPKNLKVVTNLDRSTSSSDIRKFVSYIDQYGVDVGDGEHGLPEPVVQELSRKSGVDLSRIRYSIKAYHIHGSSFLAMIERGFPDGDHYYVYSAYGKGTQSRKSVSSNDQKKIGGR